jgi:hypothetical protein
MGSSFRPNLFGRSFGRKFGVLYDDYVKNTFVSGCAIKKRKRRWYFKRRRPEVQVPTRPPFFSTT